jgi:hypothetical protein
MVKVFSTGLHVDGSFFLLLRASSVPSLQKLFQEGGVLFFFIVSSTLYTPLSLSLSFLTPALSLPNASSCSLLYNCL